jgi:hypothetical protein
MAAAHVHQAARRKVVGAYAALGGLSAVVLVRDPLHHTVFPTCPLYAGTGLYCPGCGATRASSLLLRGHPIEALHYNALWVVAAPVVVYALVRWGALTFGVRGSGRLPAVPSSRPAIVALLVAMAAFFLVRNLPGFDALNPLTGA